MDRSGSSTQVDTAFYRNYLKARYYKDSPLNQVNTHYTVEPIVSQLFDGLSSFSFDNGTHGTYNVDYPDAIFGMNGGVEILKYQGVNIAEGAAAISFEGTFKGGTTPGKLVYLTFPFETIYPEATRISVMSKIFDYFEMPQILKLNLKIFLQGAYR